jgi:hypothetical protein
MNSHFDYPLSGISFLRIGAGRNAPFRSGLHQRFEPGANVCQFIAPLFIMYAQGSRHIQFRHSRYPLFCLGNRFLFQTAQQGQLCIKLKGKIERLIE